MTSFVDLLKLVVKYGGVNLVLLIFLAWVFQQYFAIAAEDVAFMIKILLWVAFGDTVILIFAGRVFWILQKARDFKNGEIVITETNGKVLSDVGKQVGMDTFLTIATALKALILKTPEEKERKALEKELSAIEKEIARIEQ